jgi:hypothetical protein
MRFTKWLELQVRKQIFSFVGAVFSVGLYVYNTFKPTKVIVVPQSAFGGAGSGFVVGLGALAVFLLIISIVVFFIVKEKNSKNKRRR